MDKVARQTCQVLMARLEGLALDWLNSLWPGQWVRYI
jgi:hypothetical protein